MTCVNNRKQIEICVNFTFQKIKYKFNISIWNLTVKRPGIKNCDYIMINQKYGARPDSNQPPKSWNIDKLEINVMYFLIGKKFGVFCNLQLFLTHVIFKSFYLVQLIEHPILRILFEYFFQIKFIYVIWEGHKILRNLPLTFDCMYLL